MTLLKQIHNTPPCWRPCGAPRKSNSLSVEYAVFTIQQYLKYEKLGQYGDPQQQEYRVQVSDYHKKPVGDPKIRAVISRLMAGDNVLLLWNHDCVTKDGSSFPERPLVRLEKDTGGAAVSD